MGGSFASERNILQKVEAVGITCNIVQLKDRITLTAKEQRYLIKFTDVYDFNEKE